MELSEDVLIATGLEKTKLSPKPVVSLERILLVLFLNYIAAS